MVADDILSTPTSALDCTSFLGAQTFGVWVSLFSSFGVLFSCFSLSDSTILFRLFNLAWDKLESLLLEIVYSIIHHHFFQAGLVQ